MKRQIKNRRLHVGCKLFLLVGVLSAAALLTVKPLASQTREQTTVARKLVTRVEPEYPETLQRLFIGGVVRVEVMVAANGTVESAQLLGGSPILGQSAMKAIKRWKYVPAGKEKFVVQLEF